MHINLHGIDIQSLAQLDCEALWVIETPTYHVDNAGKNQYCITKSPNQDKNLISELFG